MSCMLEHSRRISFGQYDVSLYDIGMASHRGDEEIQGLLVVKTGAPMVMYNQITKHLHEHGVFATLTPRPSLAPPGVSPEFVNACQ